MARPHLSPERGENGCDPPSPYDHDGHFNDRLGRGLQRKAGEWRVEGRVPLLAYKLPGTQGCLPGFEVFSPRSRGASCHSQDGQCGGCVQKKKKKNINRQGGSRSRTLDRLARHLLLWSQDKFLSLRGGSRSGSTEPGGRFSVETEAQAGGMDVEPSDGIPDLGSVWQSGGGPLCFSRVIPVPALVLPQFPDDSRHRCVRPPMAECQSVRVSPPIKLIPAVLCRVKVSGARLLLIAPFWPSQTWFSELTPLLYRPPWEIPIRLGLTVPVQGKIWHPLVPYSENKGYASNPRRSL